MRKRTKAEASEAMRERAREIRAEREAAAAKASVPAREPSRGEAAMLAHSIRVAERVAAEGRPATDGPDIPLGTGLSAADSPRADRGTIDPISG